MKKNEALIEISEITSMQEQAIENHPPKLIAAYKDTCAVIRSGQRKEWESEAGSIVNLSSDELSKINSYLTVSSFISAWYHLAGLKDKRDQAAHSCVQLISATGPHDEKVLAKYIETERLWRSVIKKSGASPSGNKLKLLLLLAVIGVGCYWLWLK